MTGAIFLPGVTVPAHIAYARLLGELDGSPAAVPKELEIYRDDRPPDGYRLDLEIDGIDRFAGRLGFRRFHLFGHSLGGAAGPGLHGRARRSGGIAGGRRWRTGSRLSCRSARSRATRAATTSTLLTRASRIAWRKHSANSGRAPTSSPRCRLRGRRDEPHGVMA